MWVLDLALLAGVFPCVLSSKTDFQLAPTRTPLEDFKHSWQSVTDFVMLANPEGLASCLSHPADVADRALNVENTSIPAHLALMVELLQKEEEEYENAVNKGERFDVFINTRQGPCMEHLLRHNILKTAVTLGQSDVCVC